MVWFRKSLITIWLRINFSSNQDYFNLETRCRYWILDNTLNFLRYSLMRKNKFKLKTSVSRSRFQIELEPFVNWRELKTRKNSVHISLARQFKRKWMCKKKNHKIVLENIGNACMYHIVFYQATRTRILKNMHIVWDNLNYFS